MSHFKDMPWSLAGHGSPLLGQVYVGLDVGLRDGKLTLIQLATVEMVMKNMSQPHLMAVE